MDVRSVEDFLHAAKKDWTDKATFAAVEKIMDAGYSEVEDLIEVLCRPGGHNTLNGQIAAVGGKRFASETLTALRRTARALHKVAPPSWEEPLPSCSSCRTPWAPDARFCARCGAQRE